MTEKAPTYEEIVSYCNDNDLIGRVDTVKFYEYYAKQNFMFRGAIMDWQSKLHEWAERQKGTVKQSAKEYHAIQNLPQNRKKSPIPSLSKKEYLDYLERLISTWEKAEANA